MRLDGKVGKGHIVNSDGVRDDATWGKRGDWVDYYGPVEGEIVASRSSTIPDNPRHPTWWHVRDYGLFAANPFGQHDFESSPISPPCDLNCAPRPERHLPLPLLPPRRRRPAGQSRRAVPATTPPASERIEDV